MSLAKIFKKVVKKTKENPEIALAIVGMAAPGVVKKVAPIIVAAAATKDSDVM